MSLNFRIEIEKIKNEKIISELVESLRIDYFLGENIDEFIR